MSHSSPSDQGTSATKTVKEGDKVLFSLVEKENKTVMYPVKGTLLDLRGTLESKKSPEDLEKVREKVKRKIGRRVADESELA